MIVSMVNLAPADSSLHPRKTPVWYRQLNGYHWLVLTVATAAWAFDCLSQQIFNLTRKPAMDALAGTPGQANFYGALSTTALLVGWATGGIIFGIMGDRIGRAKTLVIMILCYSFSTGLCGLSRGPWDYLAFCFITGVGAGGIFPIACTLVAESLPDLARPQALGTVQTFSALGNIGAGGISLGMVALLSHGIIATHWRWMFSIGIVPSLLAVIVARKLHEPDAWKRAVAQGSARKASLRELFAEARWRRNAIVGLLLATAGVVGLWGIGVFSNDLTQTFVGRDYDDAQRAAGEAGRDLQFVAQVVASSQAREVAKAGHIEPKHLLSDKNFDAQRVYAAALEGSIDSSPGEVPIASAGIQEHIHRIQARQKARNSTVLQWAAWTLIMFNVGAFFGMYAFARVTQRIGRRPTFAIFFLLAMITTAVAFRFMSMMPRDLWMVALMGGAQLSVFGGYAIYFPELFPTRLRSTGTSFCYNAGRYVSAVGPLTLGVLTPYLADKLGDRVVALRYAGVAMCACYLVGLVALIFAPETKGQPLPE
jgi:MFS family permease